MPTETANQVAKLGGESFIQLMSALNLSLASINYFRVLLDLVWKRLEGVLNSLQASANDYLVQGKSTMSADDYSHAQISLTKFMEYMTETLKKNSESSQKFIWNACAGGAFAAFLTGVCFLYFGYCSPYDVWLAAPWPLYVLSSGITYLVITRSARKRLNDLKEVNNHKHHPSERASTLQSVSIVESQTRPVDGQN